MTPDRQGPRGATVVFGASSGIGRATAQALAASGAPLVLTSRSGRVLETVAAECRARHPGVETLVRAADITDRDAVDRVLDDARTRFGRVDAVVHSVGVVAYGRFDVVPADAFDRVLDVTLHGAANVARSSLATFQRQGGGHLVVVGSLLGRIATPWMSSYVTAKWGVHALVRTLQIETREIPGVAVSLVSPGSVDTPAYYQAASYGGRTGRPPPPVSSPEAVARAVVRVLARPRRTVSVGPANALASFGFRALPGVYDRLVRPLMSLGGLSRHHVDVHAGNLWAPAPQGEAVHGRWGRHWLRGVGAAAALGGVLVGRRLAGHARRRLSGEA